MGYQRNRKEIIKAIRLNSRIEKDKCFVCDDTKKLQNHHVIEVSAIASMLLKLPLSIYNQFKIASLPFVCVPLCEYHHHMAHDLYDDTNYGLKPNHEECLKYEEMLCIAEDCRATDEIFADEWNCIVDETINRVSDNIEIIEVRWNGARTYDTFERPCSHS